MDQVDALKAERSYYVARGLKDRVAQVDAELERLDPKPKPARRGKERAVAEKAPEKAVE